MFKSRSNQKELLDQEEIPAGDLYQNLRELDFINHWLGGYAVSFAALKKILCPGKPYKLVDIGCGGGDTLKRISRWVKKTGLELDLYGVDIKAVCIDYARSNVKDEPVRFICDDYRSFFKHVPQVDIIHACLFCHHLSENDLVELIRFALENKSILVVNDLERNPLAYYSIGLLTRLFSRSYLVKNDAPLSVLRGFTKKEWKSVLEKSGAARYTVYNRWAFRHEVIIYGNTD
jgi:2-polyprenyl-3-methyl-5-hydroxy-6-metoxy-1,4-benzoquinol methylase